jgi:peptidoglycan/xylan/chitin deacetylase (PgdA/CDA1 family)
MSDKQRLRAVALGLGIIALITLLQYVFVQPAPVPAIVIKEETHRYIPQFVVLSFDGSKSIEMWKKTRAFAQEMAASLTPIHYTYFINSVYFLTKESRNLYQGPRHLSGQTPIGFSDSIADIDERVRQINSAVEEGHEIGSHAAGHFAGADWSYSEWGQEFAMFNTLLFKETALHLSEKDIIGFRAPELSVNDAMFHVLKDKGFRYDASGVAKGDAWPYKDKQGLWRYSLGNIYLGKMHIPTISMDYNIWLLQKRTNQDDWSKNFQDVVDGYTTYFEKNYKGDRAPVIIGHHFSTWNDNVYWEAMKTFARDVCTRPQVQCVSFRELTDYLDEYGVPELVKKP